MARKKDTPKPLFDVKHDFVDSLDNFIAKVTILHGAVRTALDLGQIKEPSAGIVREKLADLDAAMLSSDGE